jgi:hypothetical protein
MRVFVLLLSFVAISNFSLAQNDAVLTYENSYSDKIASGKVVTTIFESQGKARVESTNTQTQSSFGAPKTESQNVLIYDFASQKETHLNAKQNMAAVMPFIVITTEKRMMPAMGTDYTVENLGQETVGVYKCNHFVITTISAKNKNLPAAKKDVWITNDLGTGNLFFVSPYLYLPVGSYHASKLLAAGGTGIVVKWQTTDPLSHQPNICTLTNYQTGKIRKDVFSVPSNYAVTQQ